MVYGEERWMLLRELRGRALSLMKPLMRHGLEPITYGSLARGDVRRGSDVDVFIPNPVASVMLEVYLEEEGLRPVRRVLVQATPSYVPKAYIYLDELTSISFPLTRMRKEEREFYRLAGQVSYRELKDGKRVPGMNKQMLLIIPVEDGHLEEPLKGNVEEAAKIIGVDPQVLRNRIRVLERRREVGRTGVYREVEIPPGRTFEEVFQELVARDPALRRRLKTVR